LLSSVAGDLRRQGVRETGRHGLPAEVAVTVNIGPLVLTNFGPPSGV
jgi:hypothetical protein